MHDCCIIGISHLVLGNSWTLSIVQPHNFLKKKYKYFPDSECNKSFKLLKWNISFGSSYFNFKTMFPEQENNIFDCT